MKENVYAHQFPNKQNIEHEILLVINQSLKQCLACIDVQ